MPKQKGAVKTHVLATAELQQRVMKSMKLGCLKELLKQVKGLLSSILFASSLLTAIMMHMPFKTTNKKQ